MLCRGCLRCSTMGLKQAPGMGLGVPCCESLPSFPFLGMAPARTSLPWSGWRGLCLRLLHHPGTEHGGDTSPLQLHVMPTPSLEAVWAVSSYDVWVFSHLELLKRMKEKEVKYYYGVSRTAVIHGAHDIMGQ